MSLPLDPVPRPLDHLAERGRDDDTSLVLREEALSYKALRTRVGQLAWWLAQRVPEPGARVASWAAKGELTCLLLMATQARLESLEPDDVPDRCALIEESAAIAPLRGGPAMPRSSADPDALV